MDEYILNFSYRILSYNIIRFDICNILYLSFLILLTMKYKIQFLCKIKLYYCITFIV